MPILEIERSTRKIIPDPIIATKVSKEIQQAFEMVFEDPAASESLKVLLHF